MLFWRTEYVEALAAEKGWTNPRQLARGAKIRYAAAWAIRNGEAVDRIAALTAETLADALGCEWHELFERRR